MKVVEKRKENKRKVIKKPIVKKKKAQVLIVAQEIKFARSLSSNEKTTCDRALKTLKKWLLNCFQNGYEFKEDDFTRVWKGLFYAVWMSDKPLVQEELCENISNVLVVFPTDQLSNAILMMKAGFRVLATEWYGIDQHRMDKFLMLVRRLVRACLVAVRACAWATHACTQLADALGGEGGVLCPHTPRHVRNATSMLLHIVDCFLEELSKVSDGDVPQSSVAVLLRPFCSYMCFGENQSVCIACRRLLTELVRQSDQGLNYREATRAWKQMGCPEGGPEALELVTDDESEGEQNGDVTDEEIQHEKPLDPRAGRVDVELNPLPVPSEDIANMLRDMIVNTTSKAHKRAKICLQRFEQLSKNEYPLKVEAPSVETRMPYRRKRRAIKQLLSLEKKLVASADELALRGLNRKHRKRLLAKTRAGLSIIEEVAAISTNNKKNNNSINGEWQVEETGSNAKRSKKDDAAKDDVRKDKKRKIEEKSKKTAKKLKLDTPKENEDVPSKKDKKVGKKSNETKILNGHKNKNVTLVFKGKTPVLADKKQKQPEITEKTQKTEKVTKKEKKSIATVKNPTVVVNKVKKFQKNIDKDKAGKILSLNGKKFQKNIDKDKTGKSLSLNGKNLNGKNYQKKIEKEMKESKGKSLSFNTPKKVKFVLKNNSMQGPVDYYNSVRESPSIPFDSSKKPTKTNLKPSTPSPINPFFKKKLRKH